MQNYNWNYPTTMWVGENRIKDLGQACKKLNINKPLLVTDIGLAKSKIVLEKAKVLAVKCKKYVVDTIDLFKYKG